jgi:glucose/arabinose dehydrogenase
MKVEIAAHPRGTMSEVMTGLPPVSGLAWTPKGLVVSVRATGLWRADNDGGYRLTAAVPPKALRHGGTDTLAARDKDGELAVRLVGSTDILVLHAADDYASSHWVTLTDDGVPMACAWRGDDLLIATSAGEIRRVGADGAAAPMSTVQGVPTGLACTDDFLLVLSRMPGDVPDSLWQIPFDNPAATTNLLVGQQFSRIEGVLWTGSEVLLSDFDAGKILRLQGGKLTTFADGLANPWQLVIAKSGDVYVAEFGAGAVRRVFA